MIGLSFLGFDDWTLPGIWSFWNDSQIETSV